MPRLGYAICGDARSGSTFLGRLVRATNALGHPDELFRDPREVKLLLKDPDRTLTELADRASTPNGVYGLKVFSPHFDNAERLGWAQRLPNLHFVHLTRRDLLGQAISLSKAFQTGRYKSTDPTGREPQYHQRQIADFIARIAYGQARWQCWFARNGVVVLPLAYEDVIADPAGAVRAIARHLGVDIRIPGGFGEADIRVQRDSLSDEWRERFIRKAGDRDYLDAGLLLGRAPRKGAAARLFLGPKT